MRPSARNSRLVRAVVAGVGVCSLSACADGAQGGVRDRADLFVAAVHSDPDAACRLLAPATRLEVEHTTDTPCAGALAQLDLPSVTTPAVSETIAGHAAVVRYDVDTVFLALFDDGWRVTAAGCHRASSDTAVPYTCELKEG